MREKLWEGCPRRFEWQSLEAAREKRRGGSWKSFRGGRKRITTRSRFHLRRWLHARKSWDSAERRIEMHLRSNCRQTVQIPAANLRLMLDEDETIWTESSHKYKIEEIPGMAERAGFRCDAQWIDEEWPFAQNLLVAK